ncbi:ATP-dependent DNA ligase [Nocardia xishanensis]|uniref:ATP-dependent DNA ligase n=1 Tax=Nocardia xishanensis TaxID=238964 RepID=UPI000A065AA3
MIEMKWDGMRTAICRTWGGCVDFCSCNRNKVTASFPELFPAIAESARRKELILDGAIVARDPATGGVVPAPARARCLRREQPSGLCAVSRASRERRRRASHCQ